MGEGGAGHLIPCGEAMICFAKKILQQVIEHILFTVCFAVKGEIVKAYSDLDLTMPNIPVEMHVFHISSIEFLRATFINYNLFQFKCSYFLSCHTKYTLTNTGMNKYTCAHARTSDKYSLVAFCKHNNVVFPMWKINLNIN